MWCVIHFLDYLLVMPILVVNSLQLLYSECLFDPVPRVLGPLLRARPLTPEEDCIGVVVAHPALLKILQQFPLPAERHVELVLQRARQN